MSLNTLKKSNSLDELLGAVKSENAPQEKKSYVDERLWKPTMELWKRVTCSLPPIRTHAMEQSVMSMTGCCSDPYIRTADSSVMQPCLVI